jgi:hypothetical protein
VHSYVEVLSVAGTAVHQPTTAIAIQFSTNVFVFYDELRTTMQLVFPIWPQLLPVEFQQMYLWAAAGFHDKHQQQFSTKNLGACQFFSHRSRSKRNCLQRVSSLSQIYS